MTPELVASLAPPMVAAIRDRLTKALSAADAAVAYTVHGNTSDAIVIALDIEVLTYEATVLLNAVSLMNRLAQEATPARS